MSIFYEELIFLDGNFESKEDCFQQLGNKLFDMGYVKESFIQELIKREVSYPTGLDTEGKKVAIPHTDAINIKKSFLVFVKLTKSLIFSCMGDPENTIDAEYIFILGIKDLTVQAGILGNLISTIISKSDVLIQINEYSNATELVSFLNEKLLSN